MMYFEFAFNGKNHSEVTILSNGRLAFGYATHHRRTSTGLPLEFDGGLEIVAPFWGNHLVARDDNSSVCSVATDNDFTVIWQDLSTPSACVNSNTTVVCHLDSSGDLSWYYSPVAASIVSNVSIGVQSGTNGWNFVNGGSPPDIADLLSSSLRVDLVPVGGKDWAVADNDGDTLTNFEEFMLGTNPNVADTDGDGPDDKWELMHGYPPDIPSLPPVSPDTDGDGVSDRWESCLPTINGSMSWTISNGFSFEEPPSGASISIQALDNVGSAYATCCIAGLVLSKEFDIIAPSNVYNAEAYFPIADTEGYHRAGAGCKIDVYFGPTNVSFENVWLEEGFAQAENVSGWFLWPGKAKNHDEETGASVPFELRSHNFFTDYISSDFTEGPWISGTLDWNIPIKWWIDKPDCVTTNFHSLTTVTQSFSIQANGTMTVKKCGVGVSRTIYDTSTLIQRGGVEQ